MRRRDPEVHCELGCCAVMQEGMIQRQGKGVLSLHPLRIPVATRKQDHQNHLCRASKDGLLRREQVRKDDVIRDYRDK